MCLTIQKRDQSLTTFSIENSRPSQSHTTTDTHEGQLRNGQVVVDKQRSSPTRLNDAQNKMDTHGKPFLLVFLKIAGAFPDSARPSIVAC